MIGRVDFNPRSPYGERPVAIVQTLLPLLFQSTLPLRGATALAAALRRIKRISIHAPLTGSDAFTPEVFRRKKYFNPRSPYGERPEAAAITEVLQGFQSTLPLRGATRYFVRVQPQEGISIHAPLTGSDKLKTRGQSSTVNFNPRSPYGERLIPASWGTWSRRFQSTLPLRGATWRIGELLTLRKISIHAPLTGSDGCQPNDVYTSLKFQSTLPLRGATLTRTSLPWFSVNFNPRSPYGERLLAGQKVVIEAKFQSTLPLRGATLFSGGNINGNIFQSTLPLRGATNFFNADKVDYLFQSTLPLRGATSIRALTFSSRAISIHAPLTGSDAAVQDPRRGARDFNPRSPYGERRLCPRHIFLYPLISIHAPLTGSDRSAHLSQTYPPNFNPRSPYGERRMHTAGKSNRLLFQSTLPLRGATYVKGLLVYLALFQSTLPLRGATNRPKIPIQPPRFQSTLPLRGATVAVTPSTLAPGFQSTLPLRGATWICCGVDHPAMISIHAPLTGSDTGQTKASRRTKISIHAPLTGSDFGKTGVFFDAVRFQSTLPLRGATGAQDY